MEQLRKMWDEKVEGCQLPTDEDLGRGVYLLAQAASGWQVSNDCIQVVSHHQDLSR